MIPGSANALLLGSAAGGYEIERSLRFNSSDSAYLSRTPASAGNRKTWTWAGWVKRSEISGAHVLFGAFPSSGNYSLIQILADNRARVLNVVSGNVVSNRVTTQLFRDPSAWFHLVVASNSSTSLKLYVNGIEVTAFDVSTGPDSSDWSFNNNSEHTIGQNSAASGSYFNGYLADIHFIDGQALDPTSFGEFDANGIWQPIEYSDVLPGPVTLVPSLAEGALIIKADDATITGFVSAAGFVKVHSSSDGINWTYREQILSGALSFSAKYIAIGGGSTNSRTFNPSTGGSYTWAEYSAGTQFDTTSNITLNVTGLSYTPNSTVTAPYGTNGFHLPFADNSTAAALGTDTSGNGNTWTVNNLAVGGAQPALYSSPNLYTNAADVIANGTPLSSGSTFSSVYVYLVTNGGGDVGSKVFTADGSGTIGANWTWLHRIGSSWVASGGYNDSEWDLFTWGSQTVATNYIMNNSAPLHMLVDTNNSPQQVSGTIATFNSTPNSGAGNDSLVDVPTNGAQTDTGAGGEVRGNYCTLNPLTSLGGTYSQGNLRFVGPSAYRRSNGTVAVSTGKWYWEVTLANDPYLPRSNTTQWNAFGFGVSSVSQSTTSLGSVTDAVILNDSGYYKNFSGSVTDVGTAFSSGDVLSCAVDLDANTFTFRRNNTQVATGTIGGTAGRELAPIIISYDSQYGVMDCNFGQRPFAYPVAGYKSLNTASLPAPVVTKPSSVFDVKLYTGNGSTQTISGLGFSPDLVWGKGRSYAGSNALYDSVRGATKYLTSNGTGAEGTVQGITAFNSDGFTLGSDSETNFNAGSLVAWCWDAGSSTVTNTQGSISSQVRANASAGFSITTFTSPTGTGNFSVGHGLGVTPEMVIVKSRDAAGVWYVYHKSLATDYYLRLNGTNAAATDGVQWGAGMTSTVLGFRASYSTVAGATTVAYAFAPVAGYSSAFSFTGTGTDPGPFVYLGFRPKLIIIKRTDNGNAASNWRMLDMTINPYNVADTLLFANLSLAELTEIWGEYDALSNGFRVMTPDSNQNAAGGTYIGFAWAESPFNYARAR